MSDSLAFAADFWEDQVYHCLSYASTGRCPPGYPLGNYVDVANLYLGYYNPLGWPSGDRCFEEMAEEVLADAANLRELSRALQRWRRQEGIPFVGKSTWSEWRPLLDGLPPDLVEDPDWLFVVADVLEIHGHDDQAGDIRRLVLDSSRTRREAAMAVEVPRNRFHDWSA